MNNLTTASFDCEQLPIRLTTPSWAQVQAVSSVQIAVAYKLIMLFVPCSSLSQGSPQLDANNSYPPYLGDNMQIGEVQHRGQPVQASVVSPISHLCSDPPINS